MPIEADMDLCLPVACWLGLGKNLRCGLKKESLNMLHTSLKVLMDNFFASTSAVAAADSSHGCRKMSPSA